MAGQDSSQNKTARPRLTSVAIFRARLSDDNSGVLLTF
jgi:hypothetical protein